MSGRLLRGIRDPKLVLITGAGSGIGRATALRFASMGARVIVTDVDVATAEESVAQIVCKGGDAVAHQLDVADDDAWNRLSDQVFEQHGVPDVLVNNAGIGVVGSFLEHSEELWDRALAVNFDGVVNGCRAIAPLMVQERHGQIVNVSSAASWVPAPFWPSYATAKAQVRMFSECLRGELASHQIGVSVVCPGGAATGIFGKTEIVLSGLDADAERKARLQATAGTLIEKYGPWLGLHPDVMARGIVRAVRYNLGVLPVRPEAWLAEVASRVSPGAVRLATAQLRPNRLDAVIRAADRVLPAKVLDAAESIAAKAAR